MHYKAQYGSAFCRVSSLCRWKLGVCLLESQKNKLEEIIKTRAIGRKNLHHRTFWSQRGQDYIWRPVNSFHKTSIYRRNDYMDSIASELRVLNGPL